MIIYTCSLDLVMFLGQIRFKLTPIPMIDPDKNATDRTWLSLVDHQVASLKYGVVQLVVHDGRVVEIHTTEKVRLPARSQTGQEL